MYNLEDSRQYVMQEELFREVSSNFIGASLATFVVLIVITFTFYNQDNALFFFEWISLVSIPLVLRFRDSYLYQKNTNTLALEELISRFKSFTLILAVVLSAGIIYITPADSAFGQAFLAMVISGLSAGAVMTLSFYQKIIRAYLIIIILPFAILMLSYHTPVHISMGLLMIFFLIMLLVFSKKFHNNFINLINSKNDKYIQAHYDYVTGLNNRATLYERLKDEIDFIQRDRTNAAILFMDIDDFKTINDTLGHHVGDKVLQKFASNILSLIREEDTFARVGGDEFVILLSELDDDVERSIQHAQNVANKLHKKLAEPLYVNGRYLHITVSIGIKIIDYRQKDINEIIKSADIAMYQSKHQGKNTTSLFQTYMSNEVESKNNLYRELKHAIEYKEFELYYQPIVDISTDYIVSCEALIRWNHPIKGILYPDSFIPFAEKSDLIQKIGNLVIDMAMEDYKILSPYINTIAINISAYHFMMENFIDNFRSKLSSHDVKANNFKIEITESLFIDNLEVVQEKMTLLKKDGFEMSMDDFGTGYSSLSYLKYLNFDFLKIDKSFITDVLENKEDASLVKMIIAIAKQLDMKIIAEGVEEEVQLEFLKNLDCDYYQGYLKSKPIPLLSFKELLLKNNK